MPTPAPARLALAATVAVLSTAAAAQVAADDILARGRALSDWSSRDSIAALYAAASPDLKRAIDAGGGPDGFVAAIGGQVGPQTRVIDESAMELNGLRTYRRLAVHERAPALLTMVMWDASGQVVSASGRPATPPDPAPERAATPVRLPFAAPPAGSWFAVWGGANAASNYHVVAPAQRHAYDFLIVRDGRSYAGPQNALTSYHCWGRPVLAVADGVVTEAVGDQPDQAIGASDRANAAGNHVMLRHAPDRHSLVAHLQQGSVPVKLGDRVRAGQMLGRCGNSGNTSEPHVHFHLQTGPTFAAGGTGLPATFRNAVIEGRPARAGEPVRGQAVGVR